MSGSPAKIEGSWLSTASERAVLSVGIAIGVFVFCVIGAVDWLMYDAGIHPFGIMLIGAGLAGILAFGFTYRILSNWHERRATLRRELNVISETNHHIRNALELIQLSAQSTHDQHVIQQISVGVDRIQWVLREVMGENSLCGYESPGQGKLNEKKGKQF